MLLMMCCYIEVHTHSRFFLFSIFPFCHFPNTKFCHSVDGIPRKFCHWHEMVVLFVGLLMWMSFDRQLTCDFMCLLSSILLMFCRFCFAFWVTDTKTTPNVLGMAKHLVRFTLDSLFAVLHFSSSFLVIAWACTRLLTHTIPILAIQMKRRAFT